MPLPGYTALKAMKGDQYSLSSPASARAVLSWKGLRKREQRDDNNHMIT